MRELRNLVLLGICLAVSLQEVCSVLKIGELRCTVTTGRMGFEGYCAKKGLCEDTYKWVKIGGRRLCPGMWPPRSCCFYRKRMPERWLIPGKTLFASQKVQQDWCANAGNQDIYIMIDISGHTTTRMFNKAKRAIADFIDAIPVGSSKTRVGIVVYNNFARIKSSLKRHNTPAELKALVASLSMSGRHSRPQRAIALLWNKGFTAPEGDRKSVQNIVVAFANRPIGLNDRRGFKRRINEFQMERATMFLVSIHRGIGSFMHNVFPSKQAEEHRLFLWHRSFDGDTLAGAVCRLAPTAPPIVAPSKVCPHHDLFIVLDNSEGVTPPVLTAAKALVNDLISRLTVGDATTRIGIISNVDEILSKLDGDNSQAALTAIVNAININDVKTPRAERSLQVLHTHGFTAGNGDRGTVANRVIFVSNGKTQNKSSALLFMQRLRLYKKVVMYVVKLGANADNFLLELAESEEDTFDLKPGLSSHKLKRAICEG